MNKYIKTILLSTALLCFGAGSASAAQFSDAKSGAELSARQLAQKLSQYDVVFLANIMTREKSIRRN